MDAGTGGVHPLANESGVETVASLGRCVPPGRTLLWAFTARAFLQPFVDPQHADVWNGVRYIRELWNWVSDDAFVDQMDDPVRPSVVDGMARAVLADRSTAAGRLVHALRSDIADETQLEQFLAGRSFAAECADFVRLRDLLLGPHVWERTVAAVHHWRRLARAHWIVPVWYALVVERVALDNLCGYLRVDEHEVAEIRALGVAVREAIS
jgi:hypothetical protein